ncbi:FixJ family two-component response regulator [Paraburkholderia sp. MM5384-R2]|nr:FixJ family two-component response regulator [Paraburkholderia sp. MM5384-R2]
MRQFELRERINSLTSREKEVLHGLIEGKPSKVIAADLSISVTVDVHRASIKEKLGASSIPTLVRRVPEVWSPSDEQPE